MSLGELGRRVVMLMRRRKFDHEIDEEMHVHLELREKEQIENGLSERDAHTAARKHFGNLLALREASHDSWGWAWLEHLAQDLRFAVRMLRKSPGFTAVAVLTLALGIGANTAIFSVVNAIFLRSLPYSNAQKIYLVGRTGNAFGGSTISQAILVAWHREQEKAFKQLSVVRFLPDATLMSQGEPIHVPAIGISTNFLTMAGIHPILGRDFRAEEGQVGGPDVVMLSETLWRERFGADPSAMGRSITVNNKAYTVVGILPANFTDPTFSPPYPQIWFPVQVPASSNNPGNGGLLCFGTLKDGASVAQAEESLTPSLSELRTEFPKMFMPNERAHLTPLREMLNRWAGSAVLLILGAVGLVLLIACVNVANLSLARSATRRREIAVRSAVGASRGRIVRQLLTESVVIALLGGVSGVIACYASFQAIVALVPANLPHVGTFGIDVRVLLFAFALSVLTGIVFGLVPALGGSRVELTDTLKESAAQSGAHGSGRFRSALAACEIGISLVLVIGAALTIQSLVRLMRTPSGFDPSNVLTFQVALTGPNYATTEKRSEFYRQAIARFSYLPGVETAAITDVLPLKGGSDILFSMEGEFGGQNRNQPHDAEIRVISADYLKALHVPLIRGRMLSDSDNASSTPVVIINQAMAKMFWRGQDPVGHRIWIGKPMGPTVAEPAPRRIVGIVGDTRQESLADPSYASMYVPYGQTPYTNAEYFALRTKRAPLLSAGDARAAMHDLDPKLPMTQIESMNEVVSLSLKDWRFHATLLGIFAALALVIASIGVYGVLSYSVAQRTHEIGVRMALGAQRGDVMRLVLKQGARLALAGIIAGIVAAFGLTRLIASLLYGVKPADPLTFAGVAILLLFIALLACYVPARRAMRVDPMIALRYE